MRTKRSANRLKSQAGFTLLEVIIAMAIMVLAIASILSVEQGSINSAARAKQMNVVTMLARNLMVETEFKIEGKPFSEVRKEEAGAFEKPYEDYKWKTSIKELKFPNMGAAPGGGGDKSGTSQTPAAEMIGKLMTSFLSKAIREITVTVSWKRGAGEQQYSLATYWVDLNYEFKLSE